jgi:hypothetical protein
VVTGGSRTAEGGLYVSAQAMALTDQTVKSRLSGKDG